MDDVVAAYDTVLAALSREKARIDRSIITITRLRREARGAAEPAPEAAAPSPEEAAPAAEAGGLTAAPLAMTLVPGVGPALEPAADDGRPRAAERPPWQKTIEEREAERRAAREAEAAAPPVRRTKASLGIETEMRDVIPDVVAMLAKGEALTAAEIAERLTRAGKPARSLQISMSLRKRPAQFAIFGQTSEDPPRALYCLAGADEEPAAAPGAKPSEAERDAENKNLLAAGLSILNQAAGPMTAVQVIDRLTEAGVRFSGAGNLALRLGAIFAKHPAVIAVAHTLIKSQAGNASKVMLWRAAPEAAP